METRQLSRDSLVVEAASDDGYMLKNIISRDIPVLGIDPVLAPPSQEADINTMCTFFGKESEHVPHGSKLL